MKQARRLLMMAIVGVMGLMSAQTAMGQAAIQRPTPVQKPAAPAKKPTPAPQRSTQPRKPAAASKPATTTQRTATATSQPATAAAKPVNKVQTPQYTGAASVYPFRRAGACPITDVINPKDGGVILGWTTVDEAVEAGGTTKPRDDMQHTVNINGRTYWDHEGDGIITSLYFVHSDDLPDKWLQAGLSFSLSYNQWKSWLANNGFEVIVVRAPEKKQKSLSAELLAVNKAVGLTMGLNFNYSDYGKVTDSNTLYSIRLSRSRLKTSATNYGKFGTIEGVTLGKTTIEELRQMGLKVASHGDRNEYTYGELGEYRFYNDRNGGNIVEDLTSYKNLLPHEWVASGESRIMTYNKWLAFFAQNGFVVIKDEVADRPDAAYPGLRAVNNTLGLQLDVDFNKFSSVASEGDDAAKVRGFNIRTI